MHHPPSLRRSHRLSLLTGVCTLALAVPTPPWASPAPTRATAAVTQLDHVGGFGFRHGGAIWCVDFSPDGKLVASAGEDARICIFEVATGRRVHVLTGHRDRVKCVRFSRSGNLLASGTFDGSVKLWSTNTGQLFKTLLPENRPYQDVSRLVYGVAFSPDDREVAAGITLTRSQGGLVQFLNVEAPALSHRSIKVEKGVRAVTWSPDGRKLAWGDDDGNVFWRNETIKLVHQLPAQGHRGPISSLAFHPRSMKLAIGREVSGGLGRDYQRDSVSVVELPDGKTVFLPDDFWPYEFAGGDSIQFCPGTERVAICTRSRVDYWDTSTGKRQEILSSQDAPTALAHSPDGALLAVGSRDSTIHLYRTSTGEEIGEKNCHQGAVTRMAASRDGSRLVTAGGDRTIRYWNLVDGSCLKTIRHEGTHADVTIAPDGRVLAAVGESLHPKQDPRTGIWPTPSLAVHLLDVATGKEIRTLQVGPEEKEWRSRGLRGIALSHDGRRVAVASEFCWLFVLDSESGRILARVHNCTESKLSISPDNESLLTGGDGGIIFWNISSGKKQSEIVPEKGGGDYRECFALSPDGKLLACGGNGRVSDVNPAPGGVLLFSVATQKTTAAFLPGPNVTTVAFSVDGKLLAGGTPDGTVYVWDVMTSTAESFKAHESNVQSLRFLHGRTLVTGGADTRLKRWRIGRPHER